LPCCARLTDEHARMMNSKARSDLEGTVPSWRRG